MSAWSRPPRDDVGTRGIHAIAVLSLALLGADDPAKPPSFRDDVAPILVRRCLGCHDDRKAENGLKMTTFALLKEGGKGQGTTILAPGDPEASGLVESVRAGAEPRMPYKQPPLSDREIGLIERWVKAGATFDGGSESETPIASLVDPFKGLPKVAVKVPTSDPVASVAFSPDGKTLAAAVGTEVVLFSPPHQPKPVATLSGHPGPLNSLHITPDGKTLIAAGGRPGQFGAITVWDLEQKSRRHELRGHADAILSSGLSPDGKTLATASYDRLVKLWDVASGHETRTLKEHTDAVYAVAFSPDGHSLASAGADRTVKVWDVATGKKRASLSDSTGELYAVAFAPDNKTVLAAGVDRSIRAWEVAGDSAVLVRSAFAHDAAVLRLVVAPDGKTLLSSGEDRAVKTWELASLKPIATLAGQADWPLALAESPDGTRIAVGRYDGSLALYDAKSGKSAVALREAPGAVVKKPELVRNPTLAPPFPRGGLRGSKLRITLSGSPVGQATAIAFLEPGIEASLVKSDKPDPNRIEVDLEIAPEARVGVHRFVVRTPLGTPPSQPFAVSTEPELAGAEPDDTPAQAKPATLPATLIGAIDRPGDVDHFRFEAKAGTPYVFEVLARPLGSALDGELAVLDGAGKVLAEASDSPGGADPYLVFQPPADGTYVLRVSDGELGGSGNHFYRIRAGAVPRVERIFPLGLSLTQIAARSVEALLEPVSRIEVDVFGPGVEGQSLKIAVPAKIEPGTLRPILWTNGDESRVDTGLKIVAAEGIQDFERSTANETPDQARRIGIPGGVSGRIETPGDIDLYRFSAQKGRRIILEVFGRRLGTPIDSAIEVLDLQGNPVPRAVLRPVEETAVAFRDHPSTGRNIRLTQWNDFAEGDFVLIGRELMRLFELPRNPDDDAVFWGLGNARNNMGERVAFLETTPEHHPMAQPIYKVEVHPPGSTFPAGGVPPVILSYRNDDGGPGLGKDSRVTFDPPADGEYLVRVSDVRGLGGERFGYHLVARPPRPDFRISVDAENPNVPRGGTAILTVSAQRIDGYGGPIDVTVEGLPPGVTATPTRIEPGLYAADLALTADASAPAISPPTWKLIGKAAVGGSEGEVISHTIDPGGPDAGWITVTPEPNLKVGFRPESITIHPGKRVEMTLSVERSPAFQGRVPIDVRNLPRGVRVLNIGLNGVLVTESQTERSVFLYAEPWVTPQERPFYAVGKCEAAGTEHSSAPIPLVVRPRP